MYNTASNWCKLFLSCKQEFYYIIPCHSYDFFSKDKFIPDEYISVRRDVDEFHDQISDHAHRCQIATRQSLYIIKLCVWIFKYWNNSHSNSFEGLVALLGRTKKFPLWFAKQSDSVSHTCALFTRPNFTCNLNLTKLTKSFHRAFTLKLALNVKDRKSVV